MNKSKGVVLLTLGRGINALVNILFLPYMARALNYHDYATYGQVMLIIELAVLIIGISSNQYLYVILSKSKSMNKRDVLFNSVLVTAFLSLALFVFMFFGSGIFANAFDNDNLTGPLKIYAICALPILLSSTFNFVLYYFDRVKRAVFIQLLLNLLKVAAIVIAVQIFNSLEHIFYFLLAVHFFMLLFYIRKFPIKWLLGKFDKNILGLFLRYGYTVGITMIIGTLIKRTDGVMISAMLETKEYALYRMGALEIPFLMILFSSIITITLPNITKLYHNANFDEIKRLKTKAISVSVLGIYPSLIFILFFAYDIMEFYLGIKYYESIAIFILYNFILFIRVNDYRDILIAASKLGLIFRFDLFVFFLNVALNYIFITNFGIKGAVVASLISLFTLTALLHYSTMKLLGLRVFDFFDLKPMLLTLIISVAFAYALTLVYSFLESVYLIPLLFGLYIFAVYAILINTDSNIRLLLKSVYNSLRKGR